MDFKDLLISAEKRVQDFHEMQKLGLHCNHGDFVPAVHYPENVYQEPDPLPE